LIRKLNKDQIEDLLVVVSGDLSDIVKKGNKFDYKTYMKEMYDFIKANSPYENAEDTEALALDYARQAAIMIHEVSAIGKVELNGKQVRLSVELSKAGLDVNTLIQDIEKFEDPNTGLEAVAAIVNATGNRNALAINSTQLRPALKGMHMLGDLSSLESKETIDEELTNKEVFTNLDFVVKSKKGASSYLRRKVFKDILIIEHNKLASSKFDLAQYIYSTFKFVEEKTNYRRYAYRAAQNVPKLIQQLVTHTKKGESILSSLGITQEDLESLDLEFSVKSFKIVRYIKDYVAQQQTNNVSIENVKCVKGELFLFFDTETNGKALNINAPAEKINEWPRITQLGWQLYDKNQSIVSEGSYLVKPDGWVIPKEKFFVDNNMSTERCEKHGKPISEILTLFARDLEKADFLIAHNMQFDIGVLNAELYRGQIKLKASPSRICSMTSSVDFCKIPGPFGYKWPTLTELHKKLFGVGFEGAHDALDDVRACSRSFFKLLEIGVIDLKKIINH
jgi:DNA polymerase-3 subunit epsilon